MYEHKFKLSEAARITGKPRPMLQNWISKGIIPEPDGGYGLAHAELFAVLSEISETVPQDVARLREIATTLAAAQVYELAPPAGGWGDTRTLHRAWGLARAGEPAWLLICEQPAGGMEITAFTSLAAVTEAIASREIGAPHASRVLPLHKILGDVHRRFHERHDRLERVGAGMFILHRADGGQTLLEQVEEVEA